MVSAKELVKITDQCIQNRHIRDIEKVATDAANRGDYFVKLWEGKPSSMDTMLIFTEQYDVEALNYLQRLGYLIATVEDAFGVVSLYIGWGFDSMTSLKVAIKASKKEHVNPSADGDKPAGGKRVGLLSKLR